MTETLQMSLILMLLPTLASLFLPASASPPDHRYHAGDNVPLFVNKVGSLNNPSETYQYYELPFCSPDQVVKKKESLGEVLNGDRLTDTLYKLRFRESKIEEILCVKKLRGDEVARFRDAVIRDFYFQMHCDGLPFWGFIGKVEEHSLDGKEIKYYLFKHVQLHVLYNGNQVIEMHAFSDPNHVVDITEDVEINVKFTYSVFWNETSIQFGNRMDRYSRASLLPRHQQIHWFSFVNSVVIIVLLMGLLMLLFVRHLKNDLRKCSGGDEEESKEVGWKYIHSDVFRCASHMPLFCAVLGSGTQLLTLVCCLFVLEFLGILHPDNHGALSASLVMIYTLTSAVAAYGAASFYSSFVEAGWERSVLLTGILFLGPFLLARFIINTVSTYFGLTAALPFGTIVVVFFVYALFGTPLLAFGGVVGYRCRSEFQAPSAAKKCPREIPSLAWYRTTRSEMFLSGLLPFSAVVLELHHFHLSTWSYKIYTSPGILFMTFIILIMLTAILSVGLTYFQLTVADHEWWWRSILRGGSTAIFMFVYCIYFYAKSDMSGLMQLVFYLGYNACLCYAFFLMLGTISFYASLMFVRRIYRAVKSE